MRLVFLMRAGERPRYGKRSGNLSFSARDLLDEADATCCGSSCCSAR
jgi:hypothetical protein